MPLISKSALQSAFAVSTVVSYLKNIAVETLCLPKDSVHIYNTLPLMHPPTSPPSRDTMHKTFGGPKIFGIEITKARPAKSSSDTKPLLYEPSLDEGSIYAGASAKDSTTTPTSSKFDDDEPLTDPPRKCKDLEHFLGLPLRNISTAGAEISSQQSAVRNTERERKEGRSKRYGKWMISRTRISAKKELWVSRAKQMMQQNVLRRHSFGNQV